MDYFTSDWHLGESRIGINGKPNLFYRPFASIEAQNNAIVDNIYDCGFRNGDTLYHLGDVIVDFYYLSLLRAVRNQFSNSKFFLTEGNYDTDKLDILLEYFELAPETVEIKGREYYLNHYPANCTQKEFAITGHIHGLWKVQPNMVNVGVDAWHFRPVPADTIDFVRTACEKYYDKNVFPYTP